MSKIIKKLQKVPYLTLLLLLMSNIGMPSYAMQKESTALSKALGFLAKSGLTYAQIYATAYLSTLSHECGHALTAKLLLNVKDIKINIPLKAPWKNPLAFPMKGDTCFSTQIGSINKYTYDKNYASRLVLTLLMGPLFGLASCYCLLKTNNILNEYISSNNNAFSNILLNGFQRPLLNKDQNPFIQVMIILCAYYDIEQLFGLHNQICDGSKILHVLNIENPGKKYPALFKNTTQILSLIVPAVLLIYTTLKR